MAFAITKENIFCELGDSDPGPAWGGIVDAH